MLNVLEASPHGLTCGEVTAAVQGKAPTVYAVLKRLVATGRVRKDGSVYRAAGAPAKEGLRR